MAARIMTDAMAEKLLSGNAGCVINAPLTWKQKNHPKSATTPVHVEGTSTVSSNLGMRLELRMRIGLDRPWDYTLLILSPVDGVCLRRLDVRGTHRDRLTGEDFINRTHKHKWSEARGNSEVYSPDDIRHTPGPLLHATLASMDEEYERVVRDFVAECRMMLGSGYAWTQPPAAAVQDPFDGLEEYP